MSESILIADDSALMRKILCDIISEKNPSCHIVYAMDGMKTMERLRKGDVDICILDMYLRGMNGLEIVKNVCDQSLPVRIILIGSPLQEDSDAASLLMGLKNVIYLQRPFQLMGSEFDSFSEKVANAYSRLIGRKTARCNKTPEIHPLGNLKKGTHSGSRKIVLIASSTGGPQALHKLLPMLPAELGAPVVVVQHMPKGFTATLAERININSALTVKEACDNEPIRNNVVYIARGGKHLIAHQEGGRCMFRLSDDPPVMNLRPSADITFSSFKEMPYDKIIAVVLTGMGHDGLYGILQLKKKKKLHVITQNEDTCVVYGMPKSCDEAGVSDESLPVERIADAIVKELGV